MKEVLTWLFSDTVFILGYDGMMLMNYGLVRVCKELGFLDMKQGLVTQAHQVARSNAMVDLRYIHVFENYGSVLTTVDVEVMLLRYFKLKLHSSGTDYTDGTILVVI